MGTIDNEPEFTFCNTEFRSEENLPIHFCPKCGYRYVNILGTCGRKIYKNENHDN